MGFGDLNKEEQQALDQLQKTCASRKKLSLQTRQNCALLKRQQAIIDQQNIQAAQILLAQKQANELLALLNQKVAAIGFVSQWMSDLQSMGQLIPSALFKAGTDYDSILDARASKPIALDILVNLTFAALPELKLLGGAVKTLELNQSSGAKGWAAMAELADALGRTAPALPSAVKYTTAQTFADFLDKKSKDLITSFRGPLSSGATLDAESRTKFNAYQAKNTIISSVLGDLSTKLAVASQMEAILYQFLIWYNGSDVLSKLKGLFSAAGLVEFHGEVVNNRTFDLLSDQILYDMLRAYVKAYFIVRTHRSDTIDDLPEDYADFVEGLDGAQRKMIYGRFGAASIKWSNSARPPVDDYKDLVKKWSAALVANRPVAPLLNAMSD
jgi:hypothetical protein